MSMFGKLDEYNETDWDWRHYIERVNHFFEANEITDPNKRRSIFLVCVGAKTYKLVWSLVAPEDPKDKGYEDLAKLLQDHFMPKPSAVVQRLKFNTRSQQPDETIVMFLAELRANAQKNRANRGHSSKPKLPSFSVCNKVLMSL